jgi:hypothetical protein
VKAAEDASDLSEGCQEQMGDLLEEAKALDSRLGVGLNYESYSEKVADVNVVYNDIDYSDDPEQLECITNVGLPLEKAVNQFVSAYRLWNDCFEDFNCDNDSIDDDLQARWSKATSAVDRADRALERMDDASDRASKKMADAQAHLEEAKDELQTAQAALN